jgi:hypothetical protein
VSIQAPVTSTAGSGLFDDVVNGGCLLLASDSVSLDPARRQALAEMGLPVVALGTAPADGVVVDDTGAYRTWLDELQADAVLIRPDFAVYGTARSGGDVTELVDQFFAALVHSAPAATPLAGVPSPA